MAISPLQYNFNTNNYRPTGVEKPDSAQNDPGISSSENAKKLPGMHDGEDGKVKSQQECETCRKRKYQDGSDEMVSFKTAQHMSPESAAVRVRAHEQEHVSNAYTKAAQEGGKVLRASVAIHTAICPECGHTYVSGGVTSTAIRYNNEKNPYEQDKKARDYGKLAGAHAKYDV